MPDYTGTSNDDTIIGTDGNDLINPLGGSDSVSALGGNDTVYASVNDTSAGGVILDSSKSPTSQFTIDDDYTYTYESSGSPLRGGVPVNNEISSGKWYWEQTIDANSDGNIWLGLIAPANSDWDSSNGSHMAHQEDVYLFKETGWITVGTGSGRNTYLSADSSNGFEAGDVIGIAFDADSGKIWISVNGTWIDGADEADVINGTNATISGIPSGSYMPFGAGHSGHSSDTHTVTFDFSDANANAPDGFTPYDNSHLSNGIDTVDGGDGIDTLDFSLSQDAIDMGTDRLDFSSLEIAGDHYSNFENLTGSAFGDRLNGGHDDSVIFGGLGDDTLHGNQGDDNLSGGNGDDLILGGDHNDLIEGDAGNDTLDGGDDDDFIFGDAGNDQINGGGQWDTLHGGDGNDTIDGDGGSDLLFGDAGNDYLDGNGGNDTINGGAGDDTLVAGGGNNTFAFTPGFGQDVITDFDSSRDFLDISDLNLRDTDLSFTDIGNDVKIEDGAGNSILLEGVSTSDLDFSNFIQDDVAPIITVHSLVTEDNTPVISGTIDDPTATITVTVNGNSYSGVHGSNGDWSVEITDTLPSGQYLVSAQAQDASGNIGYSAPEADFTEQTDSGNPFDGIDVGVKSSVYFADFDNDGDEDLVVGDGNGQFHYFINDSSGETPVFTEASNSENPFSDIDLGVNARMFAVDIDNDGDLDVFAGSSINGVRFYQNDGDAWFPDFNPDVPNPLGDVNDYRISPSFDDINGDGLMDFVFGDKASELSYILNTGTAESPVFDSESVVLITDVGHRATIGQYDYDLDGDLDLYMGETDGIITLYQNNGNGDYQLVNGDANMFSGIDFGEQSVIDFGDVNGDGILDALVGSRTGEIRYFVGEQPGTVTVIGDSTGTPTNNSDHLIGTPDHDIIDALDGDDTIEGRAGNDTLMGSNGDDLIYGEEGSDELHGGYGTDTILGGDGNDHIFGFSPDTGVGPYSVQTLEGDIIDGGNGHDYIVGTGGIDYITGGLGNDTIRGLGNDDTLVGGDGNDFITSEGSGKTLILGNEGDDRLIGQGDSDTLYGGNGNDTIDGRAHMDYAYGGNGDDVLLGSNQADLLYGENDNDSLIGGNGQDTLDGGSGDDTLIGALGDDILTGGEGVDSFVFTTRSGGDEDEITDFNVDQDILVLSDTHFDFTVIDEVMQKATYSESAGGLIIDLGGNNDLLLVGIEMNDLTAMTIEY